MVTPGSAVATVVDPASMRLEGSVPAEQVASLRVGAAVQFRVNGYPDRVFTGKVDRINPTADPATRQVRVYVSIPNEGGALVGGLFAQGRVATSSRMSTTAPLSAVDDRGTAPTVMRLAKGRAERVTVKTGLRDPETDRVELLAGVAPGDTLLIGAAQGLTAGTAVKVTATPSDQAAGVRTAAPRRPRSAHRRCTNHFPVPDHVDLRFRHQASDHHRHHDGGARRVRHRGADQSATPTSSPTCSSR